MAEINDSVFEKAFSLSTGAVDGHGEIDETRREQAKKRAELTKELYDIMTK